jgi:hypothetical protein
MIVRAPVAETELQHVARQIGDQLCGVVETRALRLEAANERVEATHRHSADMLSATATTFWVKGMFDFQHSASWHRVRIASPIDSSSTTSDAIASLS